MEYREALFRKYRTTQQLATTFDVAAAKLWSRNYSKYLADFLPRRPDAAIVDIGCGGGQLLWHLASLGYSNVYGVDISDEQVKVAQQISDKVARGDATSFLTCHRSSFDSIIAIDVIEHLQKHEIFAFLSAAREALLPGGTLILQTPNCGVTGGVATRFADFTHEVGFTPNSLGWVLRASGFRSIEHREQGPIMHGVVSLIRIALWRSLRLCYKAIDLVETGRTRSIYSRVFVTYAVKV